jgi:Cysteine rich repeat
MIRSCLAKSVAMSVAMPVAMSVVLIVSGAASAQPGHDACARDVSRFCRAQINDGEQVVLACLKQNRAKLSKACEKVLTEHGQ